MARLMRTNTVNIQPFIPISKNINRIILQLSFNWLQNLLRKDAFLGPLRFLQLLKEIQHFHRRFHNQLRRLSSVGSTILNKNKIREVTQTVGRCSKEPPDMVPFVLLSPPACNRVCLVFLIQLHEEAHMIALPPRICDFSAGNWQILLNTTT